jgi:hypothetical protein
MTDDGRIDMRIHTAILRANIFKMFDFTSALLILFSIIHINSISLTIKRYSRRASVLNFSRCSQLHKSKSTAISCPVMIRTVRIPILNKCRWILIMILQHLFRGHSRRPMGNNVRDVRSRCRCRSNPDSDVFFSTAVNSVSTGVVGNVRHPSVITLV